MARASSEAQRRFVRNLVRFLPLSPALFVGPAWAQEIPILPSQPSVDRGQEQRGPARGLPAQTGGDRQDQRGGGGRVRIVPTLAAEETYTDNLRLAPDGAKRSDWVTIVTPGISVNATGARLRLNANYGAQTLYRANEGTNALNHQLNAIGDAELLEHLVFVDASASISQRNTSVLSPQSLSPVNNTGNQTTVSSYLISPFLRHNFGTDAQGEVRLTYSMVDSSGASASDSGATRFDARLASGPAYKLFRWNVAYSREAVEYERTADTTSETITLGVQRMITPTVTSVSTVGYEESNYATIGGAPKGYSWSTGFSWTPTPRTDLTATTGKRYFGTTRAFSFSHRMRLLTVSAAYSEDITSTRSQLLLPSSANTADVLNTLFLSQFPDPVVRQQAIQTFISENALPPTLLVPVEFFTNQFFLTKSWRASVGYQGARNTVLGNFFSTTRDAQQVGTAAGGAGDFATSSTVKQTGGSATWSLRISERDASNVSVGYSRSELPGIAREDNYTYLRMSLTRQFEPKLVGVLSFRRLQADSNQGGTGTYTENAVSAAIQMSF